LIFLIKVIVLDKRASRLKSSDIKIYQDISTRLDIFEIFDIFDIFGFF